MPFKHIVIFFLNRGAFSPHSRALCTGIPRSPGIELRVAGRASGLLAPNTSSLFVLYMYTAVSLGSFNNLPRDRGLLIEEFCCTSFRGMISMDLFLLNLICSILSPCLCLLYQS
jgi:hypothetical protein